MGRALKLVPSSIKGFAALIRLFSEALETQFYFKAAEASRITGKVTTYEEGSTQPVPIGVSSAGIITSLHRKMEFFLSLTDWGFQTRTFEDIYVAGWQRHVVAITGIPIPIAKLIAVTCLYSLSSPVEINLVTNHLSDPPEPKEGSISADSTGLRYFYRHTSVNSMRGCFYTEEDFVPHTRYRRIIHLKTANPEGLQMLLSLVYGHENTDYARLPVQIWVKEDQDPFGIFIGKAWTER